MNNRPRKFTNEINRDRSLEVLAMYEAGETVKQLADRLGRDESWVKDRIRFARRIRTRIAAEAV